jgi:ribose transport system permease protein
VANITILAEIALVMMVIVAILVRRMLWGRKFELVGADPRAGRAAGLPATHHQVSSYMVAGVSYALAGPRPAGFLCHPQLDTGNDFLLPSVAVVVLGAPGFGRGRGSVIATAASVLFLSQLDPALEILVGSIAIPDVIQGAIVALCILPLDSWFRRGPLRNADPGNGS